MPTPNTATLQVVLNGGAPQTGVIAAAFADSVVLKLADASGVKKVKYRIYEYPEGFACPVGWTAGALAYEIVVANGAPAPAFSLPASNPDLRGQYLFDVEVNDRKRNGALDNALYDNATLLEIPFTSIQLKDCAYLIDKQADNKRGWAGSLKRLIRYIDQVIISPGGTGDVVGPGSASDDRLALMSGATGKAIKQSALLVSELGLNVVSFGARPSASAAANVIALTAACAAAAAAGAWLFWPDGVFSTNATIPLLHTVRHRGPGKLLRGGDSFQLEPRDGQTNRLYIAPSGNAANDGLSATQPMATPQNAFDALKNYGPTLDGTWRIVCAAGTWTGTVHRNQHTTPSKNPVILEGPSVGGHPNVPTAIFDGNTNRATDDWCIRAVGYGVQIDLRDLAARNYVGLTDSSGFTADYGAAIYASNCHSSGHSFADFYLQGCATVRIGGGIWTSPRGLLLNSCGDTTIGYGSPVRCNGNTHCGMEWSRGSEGHIDFCEFNDCAVGVDLVHGGRVHLDQNNFKRSTTGAVRVRSGGYYFDNANVMNDGTADANAVNFLHNAFAGENEADLWNSESEIRIAKDLNTYTNTGNTTTNVVATPYTVKANRFEDKTKKLRIRITGQLTTAGAPSRVGIVLGGVTIDQVTAPGSPAANAIFIYDMEIFAIGQDSQSFFSSFNYSGNTAGPVIVSFSKAANTDADAALEVTLKCNSSGDIVKVYSIEVWKTG